MRRISTICAVAGMLAAFVMSTNVVWAATYFQPKLPSVSVPGETPNPNVTTPKITLPKGPVLRGGAKLKHIGPNQ